MTPREYGNLVHGRTVAQPARGDVAIAMLASGIDFTGAARISVSASSHRAMIVWRDGRKPTEFAEGTDAYKRVIAYGRANGVATVWRMSGVTSWVLDKAG